jgi:cytochrome P450
LRTLYTAEKPSGHVAVEDVGDTLSPNELLLMLRLLLVADHETTTDLIGNGLLARLHHPQQLHVLREESGPMESAIEEFLRYDSAVPVDAREPQDWSAGPTWRAARVQPPSERRRCGH